MVATAAGAGLRWGECVGLRRRNVDLLRRELQVVEVAVEVDGRVTSKPYPKSKASRRTVPLPDFLIEALAEHLAAFPAELDELVFSNQRGGPLLRANFRQRVWLPALARSGLVERLEGGDAIVLGCVSETEVAVEQAPSAAAPRCLADGPVLQ